MTSPGIKEVLTVFSFPAVRFRALGLLISDGSGPTRYVSVQHVTALISIKTHR